MGQTLAAGRHCMVAEELEVGSPLPHREVVNSLAKTLKEKAVRRHYCTGMVAGGQTPHSPYTYVPSHPQCPPLPVSKWAMKKDKGMSKRSLRDRVQGWVDLRSVLKQQLS